MKPSYIIAAMLALTQPALAAKFHKIRKPTNPNVATAYRAAHADPYLLQTAVKIDERTPAQGRSAAEVREKTVDQVAHTLCSFFDDGVGVSKQANTAYGVEKAMADLEDSEQFEDDAQKVKTDMIDALDSAVRSRSIEIYSGSAGGNNTSGSILGVYDTARDEVVVFSFTNCGSDD